MSDSAVVEIVMRAKDESRGAFESLRSHLEGLHGSFDRIKDVALGNILGGLGVEGIDEALHSVVEFGKGLIDANAEIQMMRQRLDILYSSAKEGGQAFAFLTQNELTKPFDIESIMQASTQLVAFKQDITTVLPALEDVAGAMGQSLPVAARAFNDALMGRFAMLKNDLGISKEMLVQFGLEMNKAGHITDPASFTKAFLALANSQEFKGGADKLSQTWQGLMSSMSSQWFYFKANLGQGAFTVLEHSLSGIVHTLQDPKNAAGIKQIETALGGMLGKAAADVVQLGQALIANLPAAIGTIEALWQRFGPIVAASWNMAATEIRTVVNWIGGNVLPVIATVVTTIAQHWGQIVGATQSAWNLAARAIGAFVNWFGGAVLPVIETVIGTIAQWWQQHGQQVQQAITYIWNLVKDWLGVLLNGMRDGWNFLVADAKMAWDALTGVWQIGSDALSGNWSAVKDDLIQTGRVLGADLVSLFGLMVSSINSVVINIPLFMINAFIQVIPALGGPLNGIISAFNEFVEKFKGPIGVMAGILAAAFSPFVAAANLAINAVMASLRTVIDHVPDFVLQHTPHGEGIKKSIDSFKGLSIPSPKDAYNAANSAVQSFKGVNDGKPLDFTKIAKDLGVGVNQIADVMKKYGVTGVKDMMGALANWLDPNSPEAKQTTDSAKKLGAEIIQNLFAGLGGLGGTLKGGALNLDDLLGLKTGKKLTWADIMAQLGVTGGAGGPGAALPTSLPVAGPVAGPDAAAGGAAGPSYTFPAIAQNLGQLAAAFGGTRVTPGGGGGEQEKVRQLERTNAALQQQLAATRQELAKSVTVENLLRSLYHVGDLSRGSLEALVQKMLPTPQPKVSLHRAIGPV